MNLKAISRYVGSALLVSALFMFLSMIVSIVYGRDSGFVPLSISCVLTAIVGGFPFIFVRKTRQVSIRDGYVIIVLSWLLSFVLGSLPYVLWGGEFTLVNAWFESVSGYTTTGATILRDIEALPNSLLFWRSSTNLIGGLGVIVFLLLVMPEASPFRLKLTNMELSSLSREGYKLRSSSTVKVIVTVFFGLIVSETILLTLAGMPFFDAVNHAFSNCATGGFSTKNLSLGYYRSNPIYIIVMVYMFLAALHFGMIFSVFATGSLKPLKNPVFGYFVACIVVLGTVMSLSLRLQGGYDSWGRAFMSGFFHVLSYITTTGFAIEDTSQIPVLCCVVLMMAGFQCACAGSTTGGLKADRIFLVGRTVRREVYSKLHPSSVRQVRIGNQTVSDEAVLPVMTYIALYVMVVIISFAIQMLIGVDTVEAFSGSLASVGNVGPGLASIGTAGNYALQPALAKLVYTLDMFMGRLEIYPLLIVLSMAFKKNR